MILFSHPTGNVNVREASRALNDEGFLSEFWTSVAWNQQSFVNRLLPRSLLRELERRAFPHIRPEQLHCCPWVELGRLTARHLSMSRLHLNELGRFSVDAVCRNLDVRVAARLRDEPKIRGVYAYEDGALETFRLARKMGMKTIYELPIGHWRCYRELVREEILLQPEWAITLQGRADSEEKLQRKDEELALATDVVVASEFVRSTLQQAGQLGARINILPYGAPAECAQSPKKSANTGKLKVLFAGALTQRKGIGYLIQAIDQLGSQVELTVIGRRVAACRPLDAALQIHRWIPSLPHAALMQEMRCHDVMVFPSLFEGFGLVLLEAMSQGVPVIATPNTAAPELINDGEDGFIVPIRDVGAIVEKLEIFMLDRDRLAAMSYAALQKAAKHSWEQYRRRVVSTVRRAIDGDTTAPVQMSAISKLPECASC